MGKFILKEKEPEALTVDQLTKLWQCSKTAVFVEMNEGRLKYDGDRVFISERISGGETIIRYTSFPFLMADVLKYEAEHSKAEKPAGKSSKSGNKAGRRTEPVTVVVQYALDQADHEDIEDLLIYLNNQLRLKKPAVTKHVKYISEIDDVCIVMNKKIIPKGKKTPINLQYTRVQLSKVFTRLKKTTL